MEAEVQNSNKGGLFTSGHFCRICLYVGNWHISDTFFYVYAIYHCTVTPHDIKVYLCLYIGQTEDILSLNVLAL